ncbi:helix-turn-helix domain-containing protein [Halobiforma nitratireducens]|uniref:Bacterio-opsin activator HTH domain-containing protein n=1 Tax=Halobiforma nitratireducens JCM 10879 TaxID=1227454 RepID=M0M946_9EURY|nr:helix-turn-helix domain-containing protein [Halobiforma nitratireducens]EMA41139.1 bacterio-opsin activator HTH domain-containing protein [Halobiforma nitratireducens JCM 10879]
MTTVVELEAPAARLGFARTFDRVSTFEFRIGGLVGGSAPLVRLTGPDRRTVDRALETDPSVDVIANVGDGPAGVAGASTDSRSPSTTPGRAGVPNREADGGSPTAGRPNDRRSNGGGNGNEPTGGGSASPTVADGNVDVDAAQQRQWLYRLAFHDGFKLFQQIVRENDGAILAAKGRDDRWSLQLLYHDRESVSQSHGLFEQYEFEVEVTRINSPENLDREQSPLTDTQYETVVAAHELGYFDVPREITLEELAAELDVSHQALSERLRRSHAALISAELSDRLSPVGIDL